MPKERWQEDSPLSIEAQRQQIFSEFIQLGVRGREVRSVRSINIRMPRLTDSYSPTGSKKNIPQSPMWMSFQPTAKRYLSVCVSQTLGAQPWVIFTGCVHAMDGIQSPLGIPSMMKR